jgi:hypothetical protein
MWELKELFDPEHILNPGVILNKDPLVRHGVGRRQGRSAALGGQNRGPASHA